MTTIRFLKCNDDFWGLECSGHSGFAEFGQDIVCSAISTLCGTLHIALSKVLNLPIIHKQDDKQGFFHLELKNKKDSIIANKFFQTIYYSFCEIANSYPKFVKIL